MLRCVEQMSVGSVEITHVSHIVMTPLRMRTSGVVDWDAISLRRLTSTLLDGRQPPRPASLDTSFQSGACSHRMFDCTRRGLFLAPSPNVTHNRECRWLCAWRQCGVGVRSVHDLDQGCFIARWRSCARRGRAHSHCAFLISTSIVLGCSLSSKLSTTRYSSHQRL